MKKILISGLLIAMILSGCTQKGLTQVKPVEITDKFEANESFVVYFGLSY